MPPVETSNVNSVTSYFTKNYKLERPLSEIIETSASAHHLGQYGKTLDADFQAALLEKKESKHPLYLKVALSRGF